MGDVNKIRALPDDVIPEIVREGEAMVAAQMTAISSLDQRILSIISALTPVSIALIGGPLVMLSWNNIDISRLTIFSILATFYGVLIGKGCLDLLRQVTGGEFQFPGNEPANWDPDEWQCAALGVTPCLKEAKIEQAVSLQIAIESNKKKFDAPAATLARVVKNLRRGSLVIMLLTLIAGVWTYSGGDVVGDAVKASRSAIQELRVEGTRSTVSLPNPGIHSSP